MELVITEKDEKATICLNMIVKDESHIIKGTLEMLCNKIQFDYWVICDTGSTDDTQDIITKFFKDKSIPGELYSDVWQDFAHNRTLALNRAFGKTDLLLVFDADDEIHGNICFPSNKSDIKHDEYHLKFGSPLGTSYTRVLLINNNKRFQYLSVLHEFITSMEPNSRSTVVEGDYYVVSGRSGNRSKDPNKYLKDALILEKAHAKALAIGDPLYQRYAFYCANSYKDCGKFEDAIKWYKITLKQDNWAQEKYVSCLYIYDCYNALGQKEHGFYYLIEAFTYDIERVEALYPLLVHYCCSNQNNIAYNYYLVVKDFYEQRFLQTNMDQKLFIDVDKGNFFVPYYMILIADSSKNKTQDFECVVKMFEIIFVKKQKHIEQWYIKNLLYNLQYFIQHVKLENRNYFIGLANEYIYFLKDNGLQIETYDFLKDYNKFGINTDFIFEPLKKITHIDRYSSCVFSKPECENSSNILFYVGFSDVHWNYSYLKENAIGGSEKAVAYLTKYLSSQIQSLKNTNTNLRIYVVGDVKPEELPDFNVTYLHLSQLPNLISTIPFHTVVCSRYIGFLEMFSKCSFHQFYIWAHDTTLLPYGCNLSDNAILEKWSNYIDGCVCQTNWHANEYEKKYPSLKDKTIIINNGIDTTAFPLFPLQTCRKQSNKFIYTSRTERGLIRVLELWPQILLVMPDAELVISTYTKFPLNKEEENIKAIIDKYDSITHLGQLNTEQLYNEMSTSEYWLYPTCWAETSCITALEMLMSGVICLYYPVAGLTDTMDKYGIQIQKGNEIDTLKSLTADKKEALRKEGKEYALSCSWENRAKLWANNVFRNLEIESETVEKETILFFLPFWYNQLNLQDYFDSYSSKYNVIYTHDAIRAFELVDVDNVIFVFEVSNEAVYNHFLKQSDKQVEISILNTEPMNLIHRYQNIEKYLRKYEGIKIYDYSLSNIHILNSNGFTNTHHLPYLIYKEEHDFLVNLKKNTEQIYDFGIISPENPVIVEHRLAVVNFLINNGYTVKVIQGFKGLRDKQIAQCRILLNIHGSNNGEVSKIFEHIRCDRLLEAGYNILSEDCLHLDPVFVKKYATNLKIIDYNDFFKKETYSNLIIRQKTDVFALKIYIIHYKKLIDRKVSILSQLKKYNITNYEFVEIDRDELTEHNIDIFDSNFGKALTAISLSHFYAFEDIVANHTNALIFEDDVILCENFMTKLSSYMNQLPDDYDMLFIGDGCGQHIEISKLEDNKYIYHKSLYPTDGPLGSSYGSVRCADSYIISKKCALSLCKYINNSKNKINDSIDAWLDIAARDNGFTVYWAEPTIVTQGSQNGSFERSWYENNYQSNNIGSFITNLTSVTCDEMCKMFQSTENINKINFYYGIDMKHIDITNMVLEKCVSNNKIMIPGGVNERNIFGDPMFGIVKYIYMCINEYKYCKISSEYHTCINLINKTCYIRNSFTPSVLTVYTPPFDKMRLGRDYDGGYVICDIPNIKYDLLLSCGISDDISFEECFCNKYNTTICYAFDGTIENINTINKNITFFRQNISYYNDNNNTTLHSTIQMFENIFLKMEIEGHEINWIQSLNAEQLNKFSQIAIEFHFPFSYKEVPVFDILNETHVLVHYHGNNCCGVRKHKGVNIPNVFECTYIHKKYYPSPYTPNTNVIPSILDMKNVLHNDEIVIDYEPFVFNSIKLCDTLLNNIDKHYSSAYLEQFITYNKKIVDCFTFYNEIEMLTYRLNLLYNVVDYFVIVESNQTFVGASKPLYFEENKNLFQKFHKKIIHIVVDLPFTKDTINITRGDQWTNEKYQRNCIAEGLKHIDNDITNKLDLDDVIIIADLDEIPDPNTLSKIKTGQIKIKNGISKLEQDFYYYNLNSKRDEKWYHCKVLTVNKYKELGLTCEEIRFLNCDTIVKGGWHLSYFGNTSFIKNKLENFAHQEYNSEKYTDTNEIQKKIDTCSDLFGRNTSINSMKQVDVFNNNYLPPLYYTYLKGFYTITEKTEKNRQQQLLCILNNEYYDSAWKGHFEFSMFLVNYIKPNIIVELGVDYGHSTFCLASPNIGTVYAIDCFEGDIYAGFKTTENIFKDFKTELLNKSLLLSDNIIPIKGYFDDVVLTFDKQIDILHIDGLHTYEAVKNDFEKWSVKNNPNAVIIMHDVIAYSDSVGKFFNEIEFPKFYFTHSAGLGVVCKNQQVLDDLLDKLLKTGLQCNNYIVYKKETKEVNLIKKYCFIHSCTFQNNGTKKLDYIVNKINSSGLINVLDNVFIVNIGLPIENIYNNSSNNESINKYILANYSENTLLYENPTINKMKLFAQQNPDSYILYLHTKGNSYDTEIQSINDWTDMMLYFLVENHKTCINKMYEQYDSIGCNYSESPSRHYPGNFWWGKSSYIKTLNLLSEDIPSKMAPEFWLLQNEPNIYTIHSSGVNHYHELYPRSKYQ